MHQQRSELILHSELVSVLIVLNVILSTINLTLTTIYSGTTCQIQLSGVDDDYNQPTVSLCTGDQPVHKKDCLATIVEHWRCRPTYFLTQGKEDNELAADNPPCPSWTLVSNPYRGTNVMVCYRCLCLKSLTDWGRGSCQYFLRIRGDIPNARKVWANK